MKIKRQKLDSSAYDYLGHFKQQKFLDKGHNDSGKPEIYSAFESEDDGKQEDLNYADYIKGYDQELMGFKKESKPYKAGEVELKTISEPGKIRRHSIKQIR